MGIEARRDFCIIYLRDKYLNNLIKTFQFFLKDAEIPSVIL
jgi:hypothetical protein